MAPKKTYFAILNERVDRIRYHTLPYLQGICNLLESQPTGDISCKLMKDVLCSLISNLFKACEVLDCHRQLLEKPVIRNVIQCNPCEINQQAWLRNSVRKLDYTKAHYDDKIVLLSNKISSLTQSTTISTQQYFFGIVDTYCHDRLIVSIFPNIQVTCFFNVYPMYSNCSIPPDALTTEQLVQVCIIDIQYVAHEAFLYGIVSSVHSPARSTGIHFFNSAATDLSPLIEQHANHAKLVNSLEEATLALKTTKEEKLKHVLLWENIHAFLDRYLRSFSKEDITLFPALNFIQSTISEFRILHSTIRFYDTSLWDYYNKHYKPLKCSNTIDSIQNMLRNTFFLILSSFKQHSLSGWDQHTSHHHLQQMIEQYGPIFFHRFAQIPVLNNTKLAVSLHYNGLFFEQADVCCFTENKGQHVFAPYQNFSVIDIKKIEEKSMSPDGYLLSSYTSYVFFLPSAPITDLNLYAMPYDIFVKNILPFDFNTNKHRLYAFHYRPTCYDDNTDLEQSFDSLTPPNEDSVDSSSSDNNDQKLSFDAEVTDSEFDVIIDERGMPFSHL